MSPTALVLSRRNKNVSISKKSECRRSKRLSVLPKKKPVACGSRNDDDYVDVDDSSFVEEDDSSSHSVSSSSVVTLNDNDMCSYYDNHPNTIDVKHSPKKKKKPRLHRRPYPLLITNL